MSDNLISINEAREKRVTKLRKSVWEIKSDYIEIGISADGNFLPWVMLYSEMNEEINGRNPVNLFIADFDLYKKEYEEYVE